MPPKPSKYKVIDPEGKTVFYGLMREIGEHFDTRADNILKAIKKSKNGTYRGFRIVLQEAAPEKVETSFEFVSEAKAWDEFCEPIRQKYGIPVYRPKAEVRR
jgi:hypothetical protein